MTLRYIESRVLNPIAKNYWKNDGHLVDNWHYYTSQKAITNALTSLKSLWRPESGFFRIGQNDLPEEQVKTGNNLVRSLLLQKAIIVERELNQTDLSGSHSTRAMGHLLTRHCYASLLNGARNQRIAEWTARYVRESVIPDDVRRRQFHHYRNLPQLRLELSRLLESEKFSTEPRDMLDIAAAVANSKSDVPELYQRLVLSTTGFLGAALEWLCLDIARTQSPTRTHQPYNFVRESLRLASPAWRITRTAAFDGKFEGCRINTDDELAFNIFAANRDPSAWPTPDNFSPERWSQGHTKRADLTFGKGRRSCPAQSQALTFLTTFYNKLSEGYYITWQPALFSHPLVGTLNSPPLGRIIITRRS